MSIADELLAARDRIADPARWCQDTYFAIRDDSDTPWPSEWRAITGIREKVRDLPVEQVQMCAHGTLIYGEVSMDARILVEGVCTKWYDSTLRTVNDLYGHEAVIKVFDEAIRCAKDQGL